MSEFQEGFRLEMVIRKHKHIDSFTTTETDYITQDSELSGVPNLGV